jgi:ABC-type polysaccharide/polyol phosphate export permease
MAPIWDVVSQMLFYATPIMYTAGKYAGLEHKAMLNPLAMLVTQMGYAFVHPGLTYIATVPSLSNPGYTVDHVQISTICPAGKIAGCTGTYPMKSALAASGGPLHLAIAIALIPAIFALGWWFFSREAPRVAENL